MTTHFSKQTEKIKVPVCILSVCISLGLTVLYLDRLALSVGPSFLSALLRLITLLGVVCIERSNPQLG